MVQLLTAHLYTIFDRKGTPLVYLLLTNLLFRKPVVRYFRTLNPF